jgi:hypothetical protein
MNPLTEKERAIMDLVGDGYHAKDMLPLLAARGHFMALATLRTRIVGIARSKIPNPHGLGPMAAIKSFVLSSRANCINFVSQSDDARASKRSVA